MSDAPKVRRYAASARGPHAILANCSGVIEAAVKNRVASGTSTIKLSHASVAPIVRPKPGRARCFISQAIADAIEHSAAGEELLLSLLPGSGELLDREQPGDLGEAVPVFLQDGRVG